MRRAAKIDATQTEIVKALERCGVSVEIIGQPVDLLICCRGVVSLMECKTPSADGGRNRLTQDQVKFIARWPGTVHIAHSPEEALRLVLGEAVLT